MLQICDQIAQAGGDVLIFSLEMARNELISKSISRQTLLDVLQNKGDIRNAKTARGVTCGLRYQKYSQTEKDLIQRSITAYSQYADHIYIYEGVGDMGVDQVREKIQKHISFTGRKPTVLIDYVQILAPADVRASDKQNTDKAVLELKRISRDYKLPIIAVSSLNRDNYKGKINMAAFKESGAIEYGSDVLIGLQLKGSDKNNFDVDEAKSKNPREIELVILKNRNGATGGKIEYEYYPLFNYFKEV
jgi:replicative DNA helicase